MQTLDLLRRTFAIEGQVTFDEPVPGLIRLRLASPDSEAVVYLQGAHVAEWAPRGQAPVLYVSPKTAFAPGKAIRGGVPVLFPWFGARWNGAEYDAAHGTKSPAHGFARTTVWTVDGCRREHDGTVVATLSLGPDTASRALGFDDFTLTLECSVGTTLRVSLHVTNRGAVPLVFEEGLHAYFAVADVHPARLEGLGGSTYLDKRDGGARKVQREARFAFTRDVDQVHLHTGAAMALHDPAGGRTVRIAKEGSQTTVIWNPWSVLTPGFADLPADGWERFVCVETVNADEDRVTLSAGATHAMAMVVGVVPAA